MNYIERYIAEISKNLPLKNKVDIQNEIRSTLEDMLEDKAKQAGRKPDEAMIVELLKEFGKPEKVAASYLPERRLIGPRLYPIFSLVSWIALPTLAAVLLITLGIGLFSADLAPLETLGRIGSILLQIGQALVMAFGSIVLTFAILERIFGEKEIRVKAEILTQVPGIKFKFIKDDQKDWNPRDLPEIEDVEKFSIPGLVAEIFFTVGAIVVFNFFPQIIGIWNFNDSGWIFLPLLSDTFINYLPFINGLWGLQIALDIIQLYQGHRSTATRWLHATQLALGIVLAAVMLSGPDLITINKSDLSAIWPGLSSNVVDTLISILAILVKVLLGLSILGNGLELLKSLARELRGKNQPIMNGKAK